MIADKVIRLECYGIVVTLGPKNKDGSRGGVISSDLFWLPSKDDKENEFEAAINGLEAVVLGHACAGVDIESPAYIEGIESAAEAIANNT